MQYFCEKLGLYYEVMGNKAYITDSERNVSEVIIPENIENYCVVGIKKKAFLGRKLLRYVSLPSTVKTVGEWAFAHCYNLSVVEVKAKNVIFQKGVFKDDINLEQIIAVNNSHYRKEEDIRSLSYLLAATPVLMEAEYLLDIDDSGSKEWFEKLDTKVDFILNLADDDGYHLYVLCGEEDLHFDYEEYLEYMREKKASLCMLRLLNPLNLNDELKDRLIAYLKINTVIGADEAGINYLLKKHGNDRKYYELLINIDCIGKNNYELLLERMGERYAEMKAYLIECFADTAEDFFEDLLL